MNDDEEFVKGRYPEAFCVYLPDTDPKILAEYTKYKFWSFPYVILINSLLGIGAKKHIYTRGENESHAWKTARLAIEEQIINKLRN